MHGSDDPLGDFYETAGDLETARWLQGDPTASDPEQIERDAVVCRYCTFTRARCAAAADQGYIKCCPDCDHRPPAPMVCVCDDNWPCPGCGVCMTCGPESVRCDVDGRHCELCVEWCLTCKRERRS